MPEDNTTAAHASTDHAEHIVGIGDLRVVLIEEGNYWFAQGLEIDYLAQGSSIKDAKDKFETGLAATFYENLRIHGTIQPLLVPAPVEIWKERFNPGSKAKRYRPIPVHQIPDFERFGSALSSELPFQAIEYLQAVA